MVKGTAMIGEIHRLRDKPGETEKITINVGFVDLGHIDLLVHEGFYSNRTDFIRTAIRNQLAAHADAVKQSIGIDFRAGAIPANPKSIVSDSGDYSLMIA